MPFPVWLVDGRSVPKPFPCHSERSRADAFRRKSDLRRVTAKTRPSRSRQGFVLRAFDAMERCSAVCACRCERNNRPRAMTHRWHRAIGSGRAQPRRSATRQEGLVGTSHSLARHSISSLSRAGLPTRGRSRALASGDGAAVRAHDRAVVASRGCLARPCLIGPSQPAQVRAAAALARHAQHS